MDITSPTSALHSVADQAAHGVDDAGAGCTVYTATQGQEKSGLEGATKYCVNQAADRQAVPHSVCSLAQPCESQSPKGIQLSTIPRVDR